MSGEVATTSELCCDAPSPSYLTKKELGNRKYSPEKWKRPLEEHRLSSLKIVGTIPVIFSSRAAATCMDIDSCEGDFLLAGSSKGSIDIVNLRYAHERPKMDKPAISAKYSHKKMVNALQWYSENISMFVSAGQDGEVALWDLNRQRPFERYSVDDARNLHWNEIDKKNPLIAVCNDTSNVVLIDCRQGNYAQNIRNKTHARTVRWYPASEKLLSTGDSQGNLCFWDIRNCREALRRSSICREGQVGAIRFTSDGRYAVCIDPNRLRVHVLDAITWESLVTTIATQNRVQKVHPNSRNLCIIEDGNYLRIGVPSTDENFGLIAVDLTQRRIVSQHFLTGHLNTVSSCTYRPGYQQLLTASLGMVINWSSEGERARANLESESHYQRTREDDWSDSE